MDKKMTRMKLISCVKTKLNCYMIYCTYTQLHLYILQIVMYKMCYFISDFVVILL